MMKKRSKVAAKVSVVTIMVNMVLSAVKIVAGSLGNSGAVVADGIHSLSDVFSTAVAYVGIKISDKSADENHPYGHEKFEPVMSKLLAIILAVTAIGIFYDAVKALLAGEIPVPGNSALVAAVLSIVIKEWMFRYTIRAADMIDSSALRADAWHHRTDSFSSIGSLIGVLGAQNGIPFLEPVSAMLIGVFIMKVAVDIYMQSIHELTDAAADEETVDTIQQLIMSVAGVESIDMLRTRVHGNKIYVDVEIGVDGNLSLVAAHEIAEDVHEELEKRIGKIKHIMVHVNPILEK